MNIYFAHNSLQLKFPNKLEPDVIEPQPCEMDFDANAFAEKACDELRDFFRQHSKVNIIVNDATRPTPTATILQMLAPAIDFRCKAFVIATGTHKVPNLTQIDEILGSFSLRTNVLSHNCRDTKAHALYGVTRFGNDVFFDVNALACDSFVVIGSVEPHYFAGFTGGRKAFLPGISLFETVERNHRLALSPQSAPLALTGNPLHEEMCEAASFISQPVFSVQAVTDKKHEIAQLFCGNLDESFAQAVEQSSRLYCCPILHKYDVVVAVAEPPLDADLYQAHKAIEFGKLALRDGGVLILVAACEQGVGPDNFVRLLSQSKSPQEVLTKIADDYKLGWHKAAKIAELALRCEILCVSQLPAEIPESCFMHSFSQPNAALEYALSRNPNASIAVILDACHTVPLLQSN